MPLEQRVIQPIYVSRGCFNVQGQPQSSSATTNPAINIPNELECVTNGTLGNIIRQLSSLSKHAENLFSCLLEDLGSMLQRSANLSERIETLTNHVEHLDASNDSNDPYNNRHHGSSRQLAMNKNLGILTHNKSITSGEQFDQQVVARQTIPDSLREVYETCDPPPSLEKLNPFRDDQINGLKLYTNPNYFFELWRKEMLQEKSSKNKIAKNKQQGDNIHSSGGSGKSKRNRQQQQQQQKSQLVHQSSSDTNNSYSQQFPAPPPPPSNQYQVQQQQQQQHYHPGGGYLPSQQPQTGQMEILTAKINPISGGGLGPNQQPYTVIEGSYIDINNYQHHYKQHQYNVNNNNNNTNIKNNNVNPGQQQPYQLQHQSVRPSSLELQQQQQQQQQNYYNNQTTGGGPGGNVYAPGMINQNQRTQQQQQQQQQYGSMSYQQQLQQQQQNTPPQQYSPPSGSMTPTRRLSNAQISRPSAPPPAPPNGSTPNTSQPGTPKKTIINGQEVEMRDGGGPGGLNRMVSRDSLPPPPPPPPLPNAQLSNGGVVVGGIGANSINNNSDIDVHDATLPPPPPPPPPATYNNNNNNQNNNFTSPPPPPPPPSTNGQISSNNITNNIQQQQQYKQTATAAAKPTAEQLQSVVLKKIDPNSHPHSNNNNHQDDIRSNLLAAIRHGITLRRVEESRQREVEQNGPLHDVASILARRVAMEISDSDGDNVDGEDQDDSDAWDDESEC